MGSSMWRCCGLLLAFAVHMSLARELGQRVELEAGGSHRLQRRLLATRNLGMTSPTSWCRGWMLNVESHNIRGFRNTPVECYSTIKKYIERGQYMVDLNVSTTEMWKYLSTLEADGQYAAIMFDIDETLLSTAQIQALFKYGTLPFNSTLYDILQDTLTLPALPPSLTLYNKLKAAGWKLILVTGRDDIPASRAHVEENLKAIGYFDWDELILKTVEYKGLTAAVYKSLVRGKLEKEKGYSFKSCAGDQYSDCTGDATGERTWKFPNPMYYAA